MMERNLVYPLVKGSSSISGDGIGSKLGRLGVYPLVKGGRLARERERGDFGQAGGFVCLDQALQ